MTNDTKKRPRTTAREIVRKLQINDGDVVLLKRGSIMEENLRLFNALRNALGATERERCIVAVVDEFSDINAIGKEEMLSYGWLWVGVPEEAKGISA